MSDLVTTSRGESGPPAPGPVSLAETLWPAGVTARTYTGAGRAFRALLWRDVFVTGTELVAFLAQVLLQPLFILFVFGKVLGDLGFTQSNFADVLLPGVVAFTAFLTALQNTALPLVIDFSWTREIEDRLLAPLPVALVAVEKVAFAAARGLVSAALMLPLGYWILGSLPLTASDLPVVAGFLLLGSLVGASVGLTLGTAVTAAQINVVFALVLTPLLFTGCTQFPWPELDRLRWFQVVCSVNPLTYVSEGLRGEMVPATPHIAAWICGIVLTAFLVLFGAAGLRGFLKRSLD